MAMKRAKSDTELRESFDLPRACAGYSKSSADWITHDASAKSDAVIRR
jgi:hypothetical protein